ncbi:MAG TPA: hypothetical protein VHL11_14540, partial [Phototrophicaceae bacterium]|nr:hypothetical protein [Phototrophicaceae bacterium]
RVAAINSGHDNAVHPLAFSPDNLWLFSAHQQSSVLAWNVEKALQFDTQPPYSESRNLKINFVQTLSFDREGNLALGFWKGTETIPALQILPLQIKDGVEKWGQPLNLVGNGEYTKPLNFNPDGSLLVSGGHDDTVRVWDTRTGKELLALTDHDGWISRVAFNSAGTILATLVAFPDNKVRFWGVPDHQN